MAWLLPSTAPLDRELVLGPGPQHWAHAIEYS